MVEIGTPSITVYSLFSVPAHSGRRGDPGFALPVPILVALFMTMTGTPEIYMNVPVHYVLIPYSICTVMLFTFYFIRHAVRTQKESR